MRTPHSWHQCSRFGNPVPGTFLVALKTPIDAEGYTLHDFLDAQAGRGIVVRHVVNLSCSHQAYYDGRNVPGVTYIDLDVRSKRAPSPDDVAAFLAYVQSRPAGQWIAVHCAHGVHRTGFLLAAYLCETQGMQADAAIDVVDRARTAGDPAHPRLRDRPDLVEALRRRYDALP